MPKTIELKNRFDFVGVGILGISKAIMNYHFYDFVFHPDKIILQNQGHMIYSDTDSAHIMFTDKNIELEV